MFKYIRFIICSLTLSLLFVFGCNEDSSTIEKEAAISVETTGFLKSQKIGNDFDNPPLISHVQIVDLDSDNLLDIIVCDIENNTVSWVRQSEPGKYVESVLANDMAAPSHVQVIDFDADGDLDLIISMLGILFPNNDRIGSIAILENSGDNTFVKRLIADRIARVADVRAADLDGDGDMDLASVQFGYLDGDTRWFENQGDWKFKSHLLQSLSGGINVEIIDVDADGDKDLITLISQEWEEIYVYLNDGKGNFTPKRLYGSSNDDYGSSGIYLSDLDKDGDADILYTNGDSFDYTPPRPRPWQGVNWLENKGNLNFEFRRIADFGGAYNARPLDVDKDGDLDLFVVSSFNMWEKPDAQSFIWLENDGSMNFSKHNIASNPTHILAFELGDFNKDGNVDMVTGGMHVYPPYDRMARITLWKNTWSK